jgi:hypothetical protein
MDDVPAMSELPRGETSSVFVEETRTLVTIVRSNEGPRLFLRQSSVTPAEIELAVGFEWIDVVGARSSGLAVGLMRGPARQRPAEPLIIDRHYLCAIDTAARTHRMLKVSEDFAVMKLMGPAERSEHVLCVCSDSRLSEAMVVVEYHVALLSAVSGQVTVIERGIGPRW